MEDNEVHDFLPRPATWHLVSASGGEQFLLLNTSFTVDYLNIIYARKISDACETADVPSFTSIVIIASPLGNVLKSLDHGFKTGQLHAIINGLSNEQLQLKLLKQIVSSENDESAEAASARHQRELAAELDRFAHVIAELRSKTEAARTSGIRTLDLENTSVTKFNDNVVRKSITTTNCSFESRYHEQPEEVLDALFGDLTNNVTNKMLYQKVALGLKKVEGSEGEIMIGVQSVEEEELKMMTLPNPHSTTAKKLVLILSKGTIVLRRLLFGQTLLTFSAQVEVGESRNDEAFVASQSTGLTGLTSKALTDSTASIKGAKKKKKKKKKVGGKADELFCEIGTLLYERFKKEAVLDDRRIEDLIENIDNAPALMGGEQELIAGSMKLAKEISSKAKRIAGTANESVEKFLYHSEEGGAAVGMNVLKVNLSAVSLFAEIWLLDTYALKAKTKDTKIREVWNDLDGTRGLQCTTSVTLPGGFQDRVFESWLTWEMLIDEKEGGF
ncbi:hypothetical protein TrLO_g4018 [Triparma laevis f. longispina]|uniref:Uncharacterized protein n=1 Tax=Triparma laevis f. longispina TaxID=1714387 RepID=A0A9W7A5X6_9STRA|nr:hypothetical protein TrLO_g4018 [Triparma laevis f. longispina]